jgi:hypothetical protein
MATYEMSADGSKVFVVTDSGDKQELPDPLSLKAAYDKSEADRKNLVKEAETNRKGKAEIQSQFEAIKSALGDRKIEDAVAALESVSQLSDKHQLDLSKATNSLKEQHAKALTAIEQAKNEEIRKVKEEADEYRKKYAYVLHNNRVVNSQVLAKTRYSDSIGRNDAYNKFEKHFREDGTYVDHNGVQIMSIKRPGQPADFDEAIAEIINAHPEADYIWTKPEARGSGGHSVVGVVHSSKRTSQENIKAGLSSLRK